MKSLPQVKVGRIIKLEEKISELAQRIQDNIKLAFPIFRPKQVWDKIKPGGIKRDKNGDNCEFSGFVGIGKTRNGDG